METHPCLPVPLGETKLVLSPCVAALSPVSLLYGVAPMGKAGAGPALGPGTLGPCPDQGLWVPALRVRFGRDATVLELGRQEQTPRNAPAVLTRNNRLKS